MAVASSVDDYRIGSAPVDRLYAGADEIWPLGAQWPTGLIVHHFGSVAPDGWALCNGSPHGSADLQTLLGSANAPDLRDMFVRASTGGSGGSDSVTLVEANLPAHTHVISPESETHTHSGTSGAMSQNASHDHTVTLGNNSADHYHYTPSVNTGTVSAWHSHSAIQFNEGDGGDGDGNWVDQSPDSQGTTRTIGITGNPSANHQHAHVASTTGTVSAWHQHGATTSSSNPTHGHSFTASSSGSHSHNITAEGGGAAVSVLPEHYTLIYMIRL